jgi:hypothetical protein
MGFPKISTSMTEPTTQNRTPFTRSEKMAVLASAIVVTLLAVSIVEHLRNDIAGDTGAGVPAGEVVRG